MGELHQPEPFEPNEGYPRQPNENDLSGMDDIDKELRDIITSGTELAYLNEVDVLRAAFDTYIVNRREKSTDSSNQKLGEQLDTEWESKTREATPAEGPFNLPDYLREPVDRLFGNPDASEDSNSQETPLTIVTQEGFGSCLSVYLETSTPSGLSSRVVVITRYENGMLGVDHMAWKEKQGQFAEPTGVLDKTTYYRTIIGEEGIKQKGMPPVPLKREFNVSGIIHETTAAAYAQSDLLTVLALPLQARQSEEGDVQRAYDLLGKEDISIARIGVRLADLPAPVLTAMLNHHIKTQ